MRKLFCLNPIRERKGYIGHCARFAFISAHYWQLFKSYISPPRCCMRIAYQMAVTETTP